jgi:hypothetical protein
MSTCTRAIKRSALATTGLVPLFMFPELVSTASASLNEETTAKKD